MGILGKFARVFSLDFRSIPLGLKELRKAEDLKNLPVQIQQDIDVLPSEPPITSVPTATPPLQVPEVPSTGNDVSSVEPMPVTLRKSARIRRPVNKLNL